MKYITKIIAKIALITACKSAGEASSWTACQPKEPKELKSFIQKNK